MKNISNSTARLLTLYSQIWLYQLVGLAIFAIGRVTLLFTTGGEGIFTEHIDCLPLFLWNSWRFDIQAITYITLLPLFATFVTAFIKSKTSFDRCRKFTQWYYAVLMSITALLVVAEFFFYQTFNTRYNVVFFDFFDEGPLGLLRTMWEDYPFMGILASILLIGGAVYLYGKLTSRISIKERGWMGTKASIISVILIAGLTFIFMRGSVTTYTLQVEAFIVSPSNEINEAVPNAIYMLKKAYKERKKSFELKSDEKVKLLLPVVYVSCFVQTLITSLVNITSQSFLFLIFLELITILLCFVCDYTKEKKVSLKGSATIFSVLVILSVSFGISVIPLTVILARLWGVNKKPLFDFSVNILFVSTLFNTIAFLIKAIIFGFSFVWYSYILCLLFGFVGAFFGTEALKKSIYKKNFSKFGYFHTVFIFMVFYILISA